MNDPVNVSALNQYAYCPRRCALIYVESEFTDNIHTQRGNVEHERVDRAAHTTSREGARIEYALPIWSEQIGLIGKCDVVEFWPDGTIYPVEYKHGPRRVWGNDDLQLAAQSMCLEEMFSVTISAGAIFHAGSKRRREVIISESLRERVIAVIANIRALLQAGALPPPVNDKRCDQCSLKEICQPQAVAESGKQKQTLANLFEVEDEGLHRG